jgi:hypothetical protein
MIFIRYFLSHVFWIAFLGAIAQVPIPQTEIAVCSYQFKVDSKMINSIIESEYEDHDHPAKTNPESLALLKSAYDYITDRVTRKTKIDILPVYEVSNFLELDDNGFPSATLWQAARRSDFQHYACLDVYVEADKTQRSIRYTALPESAESARFKHKIVTTFPVVRIEFIIGNEEGKKVAIYTGSYQMQDSIIVETKSYGFITDKGLFRKEAFFNPEKIRFQTMLDSAVTDLMGKMEEYRY